MGCNVVKIINSLNHFARRLSFLAAHTYHTYHLVLSVVSLLQSVRPATPEFLPNLTIFFYFIQWSRLAWMLIFQKNNL